LAIAGREKREMKRNEKTKKRRKAPAELNAFLEIEFLWKFPLSFSWEIRYQGDF
jgi:hypothetical protein